MITELYINGSLVDLEKQETIVLTKSVFDINKLSVRTSDYSNVFKVPKTQQNRLIFKSAGIVNSFNDEPYDQLPASIKIDGVEVTTGIAELQESDEYYYSISLQAGNGAFFKAIKSLSLTDISSQLATLDHTYNAAVVSQRRDLLNVNSVFVPEGLVYPNVDYGYFERAKLEEQEFEYFYPALYVYFILEKSIELLGYEQLGSFWNQNVYKSLAIMAKNIVSDADSYFVDYSYESGTSFKTEETQTLPDSYVIKSPLNFFEEQSDVDNLYLDTNLGLAYTTFGYNFPVTFTSAATWSISLDGTVNINDIRSQYRNNYITDGVIVFRLEIWNKDTDTYVADALSLEYPFYSAIYGDAGGVTTLQPGSEVFNSELEINAVINDPNNLNAIGATATDHVLVWFIEVQTTTTTLEPVSTFDTFFVKAVSVELDFNLSQLSGGNPSEVSVVNSFDDINIGDLFLYVCNVMGVFPSVDEGLKTVSMVTFDSIKNNKANSIDWSKKIDISTEPQVSFKLDYAKNTFFEYSNDNKDVYLNELTNYGRGTFIVDNQNMAQEVVKYRSPFSLCAIGSTFNNPLSSNTRSMAKIFTGDKYTFDGLKYNLDIEAKVEGFTTRVVSLSRSTSNPIQVKDGFVVDGNYEVNNTPILFDYVFRNNYSLITDILNKTKSVNALLRLNEVDFRTFDFTKPVFIDYLNDYFIVNDIKQFKANETDSTNVTLIRI